MTGPLKLTKTSVVTTDHFPGGSYPPALCDADGNSYFRMAFSPRFEKNPIWKFSSRGKKLAVFEMPDEWKETYLIGEFSIAADETFYAVAYDGIESFLLRFSKDGKYSGRVRLKIADHFIPENLYVFPHGEAYIAGKFDERAKAGLRDWAYAALFSIDGALIQKLSLKTADGKREERPDPTINPTAYVAGGPDGNAYAVRGDHVLVITPAGKVLRSFSIPPPKKGFSPGKIDISGGTVSIEYLKPDKDGFLSVIFRTFDLNGAPQSDYEPDETLSNSPVCFSANDGYMFFDGNGNETFFVQAAIH